VTAPVIIDCSVDLHGEQMLAIVNETIANTTWVYDYAPRTLDVLRRYVVERQAGGFPVVCALDRAGVVLGYGTFGPFRTLPGYKYTVEHSVFVAGNSRRRGIGALLLQYLLDLAGAANYHVLIGVIDSSNTPSIALHEAFDFELTGRLREAGFKHGRWLDALIYQRVLATPPEPSEPVYQRDS
jgi:phosphinothricin acetyltransferase